MPNTIGQYTDEDVSIGIEEGNFYELGGMHVTFTQGAIKVDITDVTIINDKLITVPLTQVQTGMFKDCLPIKVQLNYFNSLGKRRKSNVVEIGVEENLLDRIVNYE